MTALFNPDRRPGQPSISISSLEPVLDGDDIQGHILPGFHRDCLLLVFFKVPERSHFGPWLRSIHSRITTLTSVLAATARETACGEEALYSQVDPDQPVWINLGLAFRGLQKLTSEADLIADSAFKEDLYQRSEFLGDPTDPTAAGHCHNWLIGGPHCLPDGVIILAGDRVEALRLVMGELFTHPGIQILYEQVGGVLPSPLRNHEHFGFRDCISQPCVRGRLSNHPEDFLTPRQSSLTPHEGQPGQELIWPGAFLFGYPGQNPIDKTQPGAVVPALPAWTQNGSLLVFRRLRQDVQGFKDFVQTTAHRLASTHPSLADLTPARLEAKLMGRWTSGTPLLRSPEQDRPGVGKNFLLNNDFDYTRDSKTDSGIPAAHAAARGNCPPAKADPQGLVCPHAAHIRKAFPRDTQTMSSDEADTSTHRLLRRGIPFGQPGEGNGEQGLLFLAYQTSIEQQFEFISNNWINNPNFPYAGAGHDPIVGQNNNLGDNRERAWALPLVTAAGERTRVGLKLPKDWVIPTGGGYFFVPSLCAINHLAHPACP